jgi:hypothetical protein
MMNYQSRSNERTGARGRIWEGSRKVKPSSLADIHGQGAATMIGREGETTSDGAGGDGGDTEETGRPMGHASRGNHSTLPIPV